MILRVVVFIGMFIATSLHAMEVQQANVKLPAYFIPHKIHSLFMLSLMATAKAYKKGKIEDNQLNHVETVEHNKVGLATIVKSWYNVCNFSAGSNIPQLKHDVEIVLNALDDHNSLREKVVIKRQDQDIAEEEQQYKKAIECISYRIIDGGGISGSLRKMRKCNYSRWRAEEKLTYEFLLNLGADPNVIVNKLQDTPLMIAVDHLKDDIVQTLITYHANVNARNTLGRTPLSINLDFINAFNNCNDRGNTENPVIKKAELIRLTLLDNGAKQ